MDVQRCRDLNTNYRVGYFVSSPSKIKLPRQVSTGAVILVAPDERWSEFKWDKFRAMPTLDATNRPLPSL